MDSQHKTSRSPLLPLLSSTLDLCSKATAKCVLLTCACGLAWASLIVWILGPAVSSAGSSIRVPSGSHHQAGPGSLLDRPDPFPIAGHSSDGFLLPGWTPLGHHARLMGREAFPEQFEHWGEDGDMQVAVNGVDLDPLTTSDEVLPRADLVLAILSGNDEDARIKRNTLRELYDKYDGWIHVGGEQSKKEPLDMSFRVIFVVTRGTAPPDGELVGDVLYVSAPDGYRNIVYKVKHMMGLVRHIDFKFLLKADDDTFVCVQRLANFLHNQPEESKDKLYAGVPTSCNAPTSPARNYMVGRVIKDRNDKWYDGKFVHHTLAGLDCYPVYMQGAFYVLAQPLVEHLYRGREHYDTFVNEDVTIGSWLLGVDRVLATIHDFESSRLWNCVCGSNIILRPAVRNEQVFFHDCKQTNELRTCSSRLVKPNLRC
eukprot:g6105.t1